MGHNNVSRGWVLMHKYGIFSINIREGYLLLGARQFLGLRSASKGMPTPGAIRGHALVSPRATRTRFNAVHVRYCHV